MELPHLDSSYTQAWIVWLVQFFVTEGAALLSKKEGTTLSAHVRDWFATRDKPTGWKWRRASLGLFLGWLGWHFFT